MRPRRSERFANFSLRSPLRVVFPQLAPAPSERGSWDGVFEAWNKRADHRPRSIVVAYQTAWADLKRFAAQRGIQAPGDVTPLLVDDFVEHMRGGGLRAKTTNARLSKVGRSFTLAAASSV